MVTTCAGAGGRGGGWLPASGRPDRPCRDGGTGRCRPLRVHLLAACTPVGGQLGLIPAQRPPGRLDSRVELPFPGGPLRLGGLGGVVLGVTELAAAAGVPQERQGVGSSWGG
jgi:hypothetical protein